MPLILRKLIDIWRTNKGAQRYFFSASWVLVERVIRVVAGILVGIYVARYLGPDKFGVYSYVLTFLTIAGSIARLGLPAKLSRELVLEPSRRDVLLGTSFWLTIGGAFLSIGLLIVVTQMIGTDPTTRVYIIIVGCGLIFQAFDVVESYFRARVLARPVSIARTLQLLVSSGLKIVLVWQQAELIWFVLVSLVDQVILAGLLFQAYTKYGDPKFIRLFDSKEARQLLNGCWSRVIIALSTMMYLRIDQIMLMEMQGSHATGLYSSAARITEAIFLPVLVVTGALSPALVAARARSMDLYHDRLQRLFFLMTWLGIGSALLVGLSAGWIMSLFGDAYQAAVPLLVIHVLLLVPYSQWHTLHGWALAEKQETLIMYFLVFGAALNVLLNVLLIKRYGAVGAALATVISQCAITYVAPLFFQRSRVVAAMLYKSIYKWSA